MLIFVYSKHYMCLEKKYKGVTNERDISEIKLGHLGDSFDAIITGK